MYTNHQYKKENHVGGVKISSREGKRSLSHIINRGNQTKKLLRKLALDISYLSKNAGKRWAECGNAGTQTTAL